MWRAVVFLCCYCFGCYCQFPWYFCWKKEKIPRSVSKFHEMRKSCLRTRGSLLSRKVNSCWPSSGKMGHLMSRSHLETVSSYNPQNVVVILIMAAFEAVWRDGNYQQTDLKVNVILVASFTFTTYRLFESIIFLITNSWQSNALKSL